MIVAGFGCRSGTTDAEIRAAFDAALAAANLPATAVSHLAAPERKANEAGLIAAAQALGLPLVIVADAALRAAADGTLSRSARVEALLGVPSAAETAALAAAGPDAVLIGPRVLTPRATCALARGTGK